MVITLVACADLDAYRRAAETGAVPVLGSAPNLQGFPPDTRLGAAQSPITTAAHHSFDPDRACLAVDEPACSAVGTFLARATGRRLVQTADRDWEAALDSLLLGGPLTSLTLVIPSWTSSCAVTPAWLRRVLVALRHRHAKLERVSWGILTAADPETLSLLAAKAVLQPEIARAWSRHPAVVFTTGVANGINSCVPGIDAGAEAPIQLVERTQFQSGAARSLPEQSWSLMLFSDHGRAYCGAQGYLCGARSLDTDPRAATECVNGMGCVSPADDAYVAGMAAYERVDPRRYNTPILISDCCGSGNWSDPAWDDGHPSLGFHALAGAASAVVTSDQVTFSPAGAYLDVFSAFSAARNAGEAVARLNAYRPGAAARFPYFLLGDPECVTGASRWPRWAVEVEPDTLITLAVTNTFIRTKLPPCNAKQITFVRSETPGIEVVSPWLCRDWDGDELWFFVRGPMPPEGRANILIERTPWKGVDPALVDAAIDMPARIRHWHAADPGMARRNPEIVKEVQLLRSVAEGLLRVHRTTLSMADRAQVGAPRDPGSSVDLIESAWTQAHAEVIERVRTRISPNGTWPPRIWITESLAGEAVEAACPHCGESPTLRRTYQTVLGRPRASWECVSCVLINDRASDDRIEIALEAPAQIRVGEIIEATLRLRSPADHERRLGAAAIYPDTRAHGVQSRSGVFDVDLKPGSGLALRAELALPEAPPVYHRIYLRGLVLLNGIWLLAARPFTVLPAR